MPHHLRLDLHLIELFPRVNANHTANHLRHDNHVAQVRLDEVGLLVRLGLLLCFAEFLDQAHGPAAKAAIEAPACAGVDDIAELFGGEVEKSVRLLTSGCGGVGVVVGLDVLVEVDAAVGEFAEGSSFLELYCCAISIDVFAGSQCVFSDRSFVGGRSYRRLPRRSAAQLARLLIGTFGKKHTYS